MVISDYNSKCMLTLAESELNVLQPRIVEIPV